MEVNDARNRKKVMSIPGEQVKWAGTINKPSEKVDIKAKKAGKKIVKANKKNIRKNSRAEARAERQKARGERQEARASRRASRKDKSGQERRNVRKINRLAKKKGLDKIKTEKNYDASKGKPTGRIRAGAKEVTLTGGGAYASYDKKSAAASSFRKAYSKAKKGSNFTWDGRKYKK